MKPVFKNLLTMLGLTLGGVGAWAWYMYQPLSPTQRAGLGHDHRALPQFEQVVKQNRCGTQEVAYDATVLLRVNVPETVATQFKSVAIFDSGLERPTEMAINRADLNNPDAQGGWQPECEDGNCLFSIFYPAHRAKPPTRTGERRDFAITMTTINNQEHELAQFTNVVVPTPEQARTAPHVALTGKLEDKLLTVSVVPSFDVDAWLELEVADDSGLQTGSFPFPKRARGQLSVPVDVKAPVTYAKAQVTMTDGYRNQRVKQVLILADSQDNFFTSCQTKLAADDPKQPSATATDPENTATD